MGNVGMVLKMRGRVLDLDLGQTHLSACLHINPSICTITSVRQARTQADIRAFLALNCRCCILHYIVELKKHHLENPSKQTDIYVCFTSFPRILHTFCLYRYSMIRMNY